MISRWSHGKIIFVLVALAYIFLMLGNGMVSLTHPDEVFYVQTAKEMLAKNNWLTPYLFDQPQFEKPVFTYWLLMIAVKWLGLTSFAARFFPALFGIIGVVVTYGLSMVLFRNKQVAFLSGLILMTSVMYLALSRSVLTDMVFSIWVLFSLFFFYLGYAEKKYKNLSILLYFLFAGLAVLTKGILGFLFPFVIVGIYLLYKKDLGYFYNRFTMFGFLLFLIVVLPWHIAMIQNYGRGFINEYFFNVHLRRIIEAEHQKSDTWYFYLTTMISGVFPWSLFLLPAGYLSFQQFKKQNPIKDKFLFLWIWIGVVVLGMQIAKSKLASYIFPVFPALAIILGYYFDSYVCGFNHKSIAQKLSNICVNTLAMMFFVVALVAPVVIGKYRHFIPSVVLIYLLSASFIVIALAIFFFQKRQKYSSVIAAGCSVIFIILVFVFSGRHIAEPWVSCQGICEVFKKTDQSDSTVLCSKFYVRGIRYYTDRKVAVVDINGAGFFSPHPIPFLNTDEKVLAFLTHQPKTYGILKKGDVSNVERIVKGKFSISRISEIGGKYLIIITNI